MSGCLPLILGEAPQSTVSQRWVTAVNVATVFTPQHLPQPPHSDAHALPLVEIIELKWLLAGVGIHIHVERLQRDAAYAQRALDAAGGSTSPVIRALALRLRQRLAPGV